MKKKIIKILLVLCLAGIASSGFLLYQHYQLTTKGFGEKSFCSINEVIDCDVVNASSYAEILAIPVSGLGLLYYIVVGFYLTCALFSDPNQKGGLAYSFLLTLAALIITGGMNVISLFKLKVVCLLCLVMSVVVLFFFFLIPSALGIRFGQWITFFMTYLKELFRKENSLAGGTAALGFKPKIFFHVSGTLLFFAIGGFLMAQSGGASHESTARIARYLQMHFSQPATPLALTDQPVWGNKNAAVKIVEFSDFQCPYCRVAALNLKPSLAEYKDQIALYFVNYPLDSSCNPAMPRSMHPFACGAAKTALCAAQEGKFWKYHDILFENQRKLSEDYLLDYAKKLGMNRDQMTECMGSDEIKNRLDADLALASQVKVQGTPTIVINGRKLGPWNSTKILRAVVEEELKRIK